MGLRCLRPIRNAACLKAAAARLADRYAGLTRPATASLLPDAGPRSIRRSNSLDALCSRYGIDNSRRTKHGALLDAEILAEVYIELIGGKQADLGLSHRAAPVLRRTSLAVRCWPSRSALILSSNGLNPAIHSAGTVRARA
jgi:DNA polymerase III epsilon subunit-like protein